MIITAKDRLQAIRTASAIRMFFGSFSRDTESRDAFHEYLHSEYRKHIYDSIIEAIEDSTNVKEREKLQRMAVEWGKFFKEDLFAYIHNAAVSFLKQGVTDYEEAVSTVVSELVLEDFSEKNMRKINPFKSDYLDFIRMFKTILKTRSIDHLRNLDTYSGGKNEISIEGLSDKHNRTRDRSDSITELMKAKPEKVLLGLHQKIMKVINSPQMQNKMMKGRKGKRTSYSEIMDFMYGSYSSALAHNRKYRGAVRKEMIKRFGISAASVNILLKFFQEMILKILARSKDIDPGELPISVQERLQLVASYGRPHRRIAQLEKGYISPRNAVLEIQDERKSKKSTKKAKLLIRMAKLLINSPKR